MAVVPIHTSLMRHPKFVPLSDAAFRLWLYGALWCREQLSDGRLPKGLLPTLGVVYRSGTIAQLTRIHPGCEAPLWHDEGDCYRYHDWLDWNDTKAEVQHSRALLRERLRRHRARKRETQKTGNADVTPLRTPLQERIAIRCNADVLQGTTELPNSERTYIAVDSSVTSPPALPPEPTAPPVLTFPTVGSQRSWTLTQAAVTEWQTAYPNVDVLAECRKALAWVKATPNKHKTARGMPKFLVSWLNRAVNSNGGVRAPVAPSSSVDPRTLVRVIMCPKCKEHHLENQKCLPPKVARIENVTTT